MEKDLVRLQEIGTLDISFLPTQEEKDSSTVSSFEARARRWLCAHQDALCFYTGCVDTLILDLWQPDLEEEVFPVKPPILLCSFTARTKSEG